MKKKLIIASVVVFSLVLILFTAHMLVLQNPRAVIITAIENFEFPEWFRNFSSDYYEIHGELLGANGESQDYRVGASAAVDIKNLELGGDIELEYNDEFASTRLFACKENIIVEPNFYSSPLIVAEDIIDFDDNDIPVNELFKAYFECFKSGKCDDLFSAKRDDISVLGEEFNNRTIISLCFTDDDIKNRCGDQFDENLTSFDISAKFDIVLGFLYPVAVKGEFEISSPENDIEPHSFLFEFTLGNGLNANIKSRTHTDVSTIDLQQKNIDGLLNINASIKSEKLNGGKVLTTNLLYAETKEDCGNGKIEVISSENSNSQNSFSLPFEYAHQNEVHKIELSTFELKFDGMILKPNFDIALEASAFNYGIDIKIDAKYKFKKLDLDFELDLSIEKAYAFKYTKPENAIKIDKNIKNDLKKAFIEQNPKMSEIFGLSNPNDSSNKNEFHFDFLPNIF